MSEDFCMGFLLGIVVAGVLAFILQQVLLAYRRVGAANRPQLVVHRTDQTPWQVVSRSIASGVWLIILILGILGLLYLASRFLF